MTEHSTHEDFHFSDSENTSPESRQSRRNGVPLEELPVGPWIKRKKSPRKRVQSINSRPQTGSRRYRTNTQFFKNNADQNRPSREVLKTSIILPVRFNQLFKHGLKPRKSSFSEQTSEVNSTSVRNRERSCRISIPTPSKSEKDSPHCSEQKIINLNCKPGDSSKKLLLFQAAQNKFEIFKSRNTRIRTEPSQNNRIQYYSKFVSRAFTHFKRLTNSSFQSCQETPTVSRHMTTNPSCSRVNADHSKMQLPFETRPKASTCHLPNFANEPIRNTSKEALPQPDSKTECGLEHIDVSLRIKKSSIRLSSLRSPPCLNIGLQNHTFYIH